MGLNLRLPRRRQHEGHKSQHEAALPTSNDTEEGDEEQLPTCINIVSCHVQQEDDIEDQLSNRGEHPNNPTGNRTRRFVVRFRLMADSRPSQKALGGGSIIT